jgi:hypothetical protein
MNRISEKINKTKNEEKIREELRFLDKKYELLNKTPENKNPENKIIDIKNAEIEILKKEIIDLKQKIVNMSIMYNNKIDILKKSMSQKSYKL